MNIGEFINSQAILAGIPADDAALKEILINPELTKVVLPDTITSRIKSSLLTVEQAKTNIDIKKHFTANALDSVDAKIKGLIEEFGFDDESRSLIDSEKNSYNKISLLSKQIQLAEAKKASATGGDKKALADEIAKLNAAIVSEKAASAKMVAEAKSGYDSQLKDLLLENHLASFDYGNGMDKEVNILTAKALLQSALNEKKASVKLEGKNFRLVNADDDSLPYNENHAPVEFNDFTKRLLNEKKLLKVSGGNNNNNNGGGNQMQPSNNNGNSAIVNPAAADAAKLRLEEFMKNS